MTRQTRKLSLAMALLFSINMAVAQVEIKDDDTFITADQMLLANELFQSGEPFAEALGYNLDDLDPMVPNLPDSLAYTFGIENYEYSRYLLNTLTGRSALGLHMMWSPVIMQMATNPMISDDNGNGFKEDDALMMMIKKLGKNANQMPPMNAFPQFADFISGNTNLPQPVQSNFSSDFSSTRWNRNLMDKTLNLAAMGQSLEKQYLWAQDMLGAFHDEHDETVEADGTNEPDLVNLFYGGDNLDGYIGQVLTAVAINKTMFVLNNLAYNGNSLGMIDPMTYNPSNGILYFPHKISVTEKSMNPMLPPKYDELTVIDKRSHLFDQISFLSGTVGFEDMMDPGLFSSAGHFAYAKVFDGDPFPPQAHNLMKGMSKVLFLNMMAMHFNPQEGTFVSTSNLKDGTVMQGKLVKSFDVGYTLVALTKFYDAFSTGSTSPASIMAKADKAIIKQANFILRHLKDPKGGFYNSYRIGKKSTKTQKNVVSQAALILGLYAAYQHTGNPRYKREANGAYKFMIDHFYNADEKMFFTKLHGEKVIYTPKVLAVLSGSLREATLVGGQSDAPDILNRFGKNVVNSMLLAEAENTGEDGTNSDGDNIPYIVGGTKPFVFANRATYELSDDLPEVAEKKKHHHKFSMYPNPASRLMTLHLSSESAEPLRVSVFNKYGLRYLNFEKYMNKGENTIEIDVSKLRKGLYYVKLADSKNVWGVEKLVVRY